MLFSLRSTIQHQHTPVMFFLGRLSFTDYFIMVIVYFEYILSFIAKWIPTTILRLSSLSARIGLRLLNIHLHFHFNDTDYTNDHTKEYDNETLQNIEKAKKLSNAIDFHEMCSIFGVDVEDHLVKTDDDYILTLHRLIPDSNTISNGKIAYLHHGLLMCSDVWVCQLQRDKNLPFVLLDKGYDVWLGNNRGNKYSTAHLKFLPKDKNFWDFSIDEFAFFDIPNSINFILNYCKMNKLLCVGFSQGSAQMFAALSLHNDLNSKISQFIAIAPAMTPKRLHNSIVNALAKSSPRLMYLIFGNKIIYPSAVIWRKTLHPKIFNLGVDIGNKLLFNWHSNNITELQKLISFNKLYSTTSVKCIVHWFQILRSQRFQFFEESDDMFNSLSKPYMIPTFPTKTNIKIPILLIYGGSDSLVDINVMKNNLPKNLVFDINIENHEHLDLIWGKNVDSLVISKIIKFIDFFTLKDEITSTLSTNMKNQYYLNSNTNSNSSISTNSIQKQNHLLLTNDQDNTHNNNILNGHENILPNTNTNTNNNNVYYDNDDDIEKIFKDANDDSYYSNNTNKTFLDNFKFFNNSIDNTNTNLELNMKKEKNDMIDMFDEYSMNPTISENIIDNNNTLKSEKKKKKKKRYTNNNTTRDSLTNNNNKYHKLSVDDIFN